MPIRNAIKEKSMEVFARGPLDASEDMDMHFVTEWNRSACNNGNVVREILLLHVFLERIDDWSSKRISLRYVCEVAVSQDTHD